jgi:histidinol-phosphate aminotransferase
MRRRLRAKMMNPSKPETVDELVANVIRPLVRGWQSYHVPSADGMVKLDAMENPYLLPPALREELAQRLAALELNRYPVPSYTRLKAAICAQLGVPAGYDVLLGNGSDELIIMLLGGLCHPGADRPGAGTGLRHVWRLRKWPGWIMWACHCVPT